MKILLDIDGVMIPSNSWKRPEILNDGFPDFSNTAVRALNKIIDKTHAKIILTTSHKSNYSINQWVNIFENRGIQINSIEKLPDNVNHQSRKNEVFDWFERVYKLQYNYDFVIIDDDKSLNDLPKKLKERLVLTSGIIGLTTEQADEIIRFAEEHNYCIL